MAALQLGCNYSRPLLDLLQRQAVAIDWIKLSRREVLASELAASRPLRPVLLHVLGRAGSPADLLPGDQWEALNEALLRAGSPHIALHLALTPEDWPTPVEYATQTPQQARAMLARMIGQIRSAQRWLCTPLLVENVPYYGSHGALRICVQPEAIWQVVEESGAGLLLDTSHARCAAYHLGVDVRAYLRALPLHAVREIHVGGPRMVLGQGLRDRHYEMASEDYRLLAWLLAYTQPSLITLEYGGTGPRFETVERNDPLALERQLNQLQELCVNG